MKNLLIFTLLPMLLANSLHAAEQTLTEKNSGEKVVLRQGDLLSVKLLANPTTGYHWNFSLIGKGRLTQEGDVVRESQGTTKGMLGVPVKEIWKFRASETGSLKIIFSTARAWEKGIPPARVITWPITIQAR